MKKNHEELGIEKTQKKQTNFLINKSQKKILKSSWSDGKKKFYYFR